MRKSARTTLIVLLAIFGTMLLNRTAVSQDVSDEDSDDDNDD